MFRQTISYFIGEAYYKFEIQSESDQFNLSEWDMTLPEGVEYDFSAVDITAELEEEAIKQQVALERKNMESGLEILAYFNVLTNQSNYGIIEFQALLSNAEINMAKELLRSGALQTSHDLISQITPDSVFTESFKTSILNKISQYII